MTVNGIEYDAVVVNDKNGETVVVITDENTIVYKGYEVILANDTNPVICPKQGDSPEAFVMDKDFNVIKKLK